MGPAMVGADGLVITTSATGQNAEKLLFEGVGNQVAAFLGSPGPEPQHRHVSLISMQFTTLPPSIWNRILALVWGGFDKGFFSLQGETSVMSANVPFTILKCCGLMEGPGSHSKVLVGHDDKGWKMSHAHTIERGDVARVLAAAAANPELSANLRMDLCSEEGMPQANPIDILKEGMQPWDPRKAQQARVLL